MRQRILTPFFFINRGVKTAEAGAESPGNAVNGRALVGEVVGGRFLLKEKTGHSRSSVHYAAHDMHGGIDVTLEVHPDGSTAMGYRIGTMNANPPMSDLPNLYNLEFTGDKGTTKVDVQPTLGKIWQVLRAALGVKDR